MRSFFVYSGVIMSAFIEQYDKLLACALNGIGGLSPLVDLGLIRHLFTQYRIFEQVIMTLPPDGSEDLQLVLAASKCLDLLLVLQTEEFQM